MVGNTGSIDIWRECVDVKIHLRTAHAHTIHKHFTYTDTASSIILSLRKAVIQQFNARTRHSHHILLPRVLNKQPKLIELRRSLCDATNHADAN